ncbi:MAG: DUF1499 domain-containing protein [Hyphomonadaceae bacterium]|nr:DUF1499 domain-containing protein [Hyphomonadaceae bacterium]
MSGQQGHGWRMTDYSTAIVAPLARWSCRIALFSVSLLLVSLVLHRATSFSTAVAMNLFLVGYAGAALAILIGLVALVQIWRTGFGGAARVAVGVLLPLLAFAGPVGYAVAFHNLPRINDVTTDLASPPRFSVLAKRPEGANSSAYPGPRFAEQQAQAYPDLRTLVLERPVDEAFDLVEEAVRKLRWRVAAAEPPTGRPVKAGVLEATDQTLIVGFTDDIVIRVDGGANRARIDVRSASRHGRFDFGQNAARVRRFLAEVQARAEATATGVAGRRGLTSSRARALLKRQKADDRGPAGARNERGPAQSNVQRAPQQKERQR